MICWIVMKKIVLPICLYHWVESGCHIPNLFGVRLVCTWALTRAGWHLVRWRRLAIWDLDGCLGHLGSLGHLAACSASVTLFFSAASAQTVLAMMALFRGTTPTNFLHRGWGLWYIAVMFSYCMTWISFFCFQLGPACSDSTVVGALMNSVSHFWVDIERFDVGSNMAGDGIGSHIADNRVNSDISGNRVCSYMSDISIRTDLLIAGLMMNAGIVFWVAALRLMVWAQYSCPPWLQIFLSYSVFSTIILP